LRHRAVMTTSPAWSGYGMTEYIERMEDGVPVGYPL
jgi:hypothetical protein